jgi:hypothetical protein
MTKHLCVYLAAGLLTSAGAWAEPVSITGLTPPGGAGTVPIIKHTARTTQDGKTIVYVAGPAIVSWNQTAGTRTLTLPAYTPWPTAVLFTTPLEVGALTPDGSALFVNQMWVDQDDYDYNLTTAPWRLVLDGVGGAVGAAEHIVVPDSLAGWASGPCRVTAALSASVFAGNGGYNWSYSVDVQGTPYIPWVLSGGQTMSVGAPLPDHEDGGYNKVLAMKLAQTPRGLEVYGQEDVGWSCGSSAYHFLAVAAGPQMPYRTLLQDSYTAPNPAADYVYEMVEGATADGQMLVGWTVRYSGSTTTASVRLWPRAADGTPLTPVVLDAAGGSNVRIDDAGTVVAYQRALPGPTEDIMVRFLSSPSSVRLQDLLTAQGAVGASGWGFTTLQDLSGDGRVIVGTGKYQGGAAQVFRAVITPPCNKADLGAQGGIMIPDGLKDNNDFIVYIDLFFAGNPAADMGMQGGTPGSDGLLDNNDFVVFIGYFFGPCD